LNELDRRKSDFIAIAAHELRTPLSLILGYAMFLKEDISGTAKEQLDIVLQSAMRLRSLIEDMINLREVDSGEATLELEDISIQELVATAIEEIRSFAEAKEQRVSISFTDKESIWVQVDHRKMTIVLVNLLYNAVKFTGQGGRIGIRGGRKGERAWLTVWDTGIGIPHKELNRIFDRFYQVEPSLSRSYEGMGLGLSIVKEMVELHHGYIEVKSQEGKGSAFTVTIPACHPV
jgi:signal transduction histidine kinase